MEKVIKIHIHKEADLIDKYNDKKASNDLINYIIKEAQLAKESENIKIIIKKDFYEENDIVELIKKGLDDEYKRSLHERNNNNIKQLFFFILGFLFIFLSTLIKENTIWKEIFIITGWVPIWEMIELELFPDAVGRKKRKIITKVLNGEIIESNEILENA